MFIVSKASGTGESYTRNLKQRTSNSRTMNAVTKVNVIFLKLGKNMVFTHVRGNNDLHLNTLMLNSGLWITYV